MRAQLQVLSLLLTLFPCYALSTPLTLTITKVKAIGGTALSDPNGPDLYAVVAFNATITRTLPGGIICLPRGSFGGCSDTLAIHQNDKADIEPFWTFTIDVPTGIPSADITIEIWENDTCIVAGCENDQQLDIGPDPPFPLPSNNDLHLTVDLATGHWSGDQNWPNSCFTGDTPNAVTVCWDISTISSSGDADSDGLLDGWELFGFDSDFDGIPDMNLPVWGANPFHKDLFVEFDWMPGQQPQQSQVALLKAAFAAAPINAGGTSNPDGMFGINLHVDIGGLTDPTGTEGAGGPNSCSDGIDNDGNGLVDAADPGCLAGDNLGGGNLITSPSQICGVDFPFYQAKAANFDPRRRWIFRYGISGNPAGCSTGGQAEIGGNDFVELNHNAGTIMHELGHTLGLRHGGNENHNCKPNYVSVMNYDNQGGIRQLAGGQIVDYSPPRTTVNNRGGAPLSVLHENNLNETTILDPTDPLNWFVFVNGLGQKVQTPLNATVDWNGDGDTVDSSLQVNIDTRGGAGPLSQPKCNNSVIAFDLDGAADWPRISIPFRQFGDSSTGAINGGGDPEVTIQELKVVETELNTTDLALVTNLTPSPAIAGGQFAYSISVNNLGPNPARQVEMSYRLFDGAAQLSNAEGCSQVSQFTRTCDLGSVFARQTKSVTVTGTIAPNLVYANRGPATVGTVATVLNKVGPDSKAENNRKGTKITVLASADLALSSFQVIRQPTPLFIGETETVTLRTTISSGGPSSPMDGRLVTKSFGSPNGIVVPASLSSVQSALVAGNFRNVDQTFNVKCVQPGVSTYKFVGTIAPARSEDRDPNNSNNNTEFALSLPCVRRGG